MESKINKIVKETLLGLRDKNIIASPIEYKKEFCKISKIHNFSTKECEIFEESFNKLTKDEQLEIKSKNSNTIEDMIPLLLNRIPKNKLNTLSELFQKSIIPSINVNQDHDIEKFALKIKDTPELLLDENIHLEIESLITKRFEADKKIVKQKTSDIAKLLKLMGQYFNDAIHTNGISSEEVSNIKSQIQSIDINDDGVKDLSNLQNQLITAAMSIEKKMSTVSDKFISGKSKVEILENKILTLEKELDKTKQESIKDHLTGLLTRRAYEEAIKKIENEFLRNNNQYAVVFFDLDHFKKVNDTYGHEAGDIILSTFAKVLDKNTRDLDVVGRYGGEEFVAIIHFNLKRELLKYLKRIKTIINENSFLYKTQKINVTFSAGVAVRNDHSSYASTIQKADVLLYEAKESGRNKVIIEDGTII